MKAATITSVAIVIVLTAWFGIYLVATDESGAARAPDFGPSLVWTGDDNRDGVISEDESGWDCLTMGNRLCG